ncbi:MAG: hypothetical protein VW397_02270 [Candidatus Margulisiibacteriota bacterium]
MKVIMMVIFISFTIDARYLSHPMASIVEDIHTIKALPTNTIKATQRVINAGQDIVGSVWDGYNIIKEYQKRTARREAYARLTPSQLQQLENPIHSYFGKAELLETMTALATGYQSALKINQPVNIHTYSSSKLDQPLSTGFYNPNTLEIFLESSQSGMNETLAHELAHYSDHQAGAGNLMGTQIHDSNNDGRHARQALKSEMSIQGVTSLPRIWNSAYDPNMFDQSHRANQATQRWELSPAFSSMPEKANFQCQKKACQIADQIILITAIGTFEMMHFGSLSRIGFGIEPWTQERLSNEERIEELFKEIGIFSLTKIGHLYNAGKVVQMMDWQLGSRGLKITEESIDKFFLSIETKEILKKIDHKNKGKVFK